MSELRVALTFDAEHPSRAKCPPDNARDILACLDHQGARATFFLQGRWASAYPGLARAVGSAGHLIGNHSHWHAPMPLLSEHGLARDVTRAEAIIRQVTGRDPRPWFRCPFGEGADDPRVLAGLEAHGYRNVHWTVAANDWEEERTARAVEDEIVEQTMARGDGAIVLLHSWPMVAAVALPGIITRLRGAGARFVTVAELADAG